MFSILQMRQLRFTKVNNMYDICTAQEMELLRYVIALYIVHVFSKKRSRMKEFNKTDMLIPFPLPFSYCQKPQTQVQATGSAENVKEEAGITQLFFSRQQWPTIYAYCPSVRAQHIEKTMNRCLQLQIHICICICMYVKKIIGHYWDIYETENNRALIPLRINFIKQSKFSLVQWSG